MPQQHAWKVSRFYLKQRRRTWRFTSACFARGDVTVTGMMPAVVSFVRFVGEAIPTVTKKLPAHTKLYISVVVNDISTKI